MSSINNLAILLSDQGRLGEAEPQYLEALAARRETLGDRHPDTLGSINNLAELLRCGWPVDAGGRHRHGV